MKPKTYQQDQLTLHFSLKEKTRQNYIYAVVQLFTLSITIHLSTLA